MTIAGNKNLLFLAALADLGSAPCYLISKRSGLTSRECNSISSRLIGKGRILREKPSAAGGGGVYRYFMTDAQLDAYYRLAGRQTSNGLKGVDAVGAVDRLRFLRALKERTVYGDSLVLDAIIGDYERTLKVQRR